MVSDGVTLRHYEPSEFHVFPVRLLMCYYTLVCTCVSVARQRGVEVMVVVACVEGGVGVGGVGRGC